MIEIRQNLDLDEHRMCCTEDCRGYQSTCYAVSTSRSSPEVNVDDPKYTDVMEKITEVAGSPKNNDRSPEEQEEENKRLEEERQKRRAIEAAERKRMKEAALAEMTSQYEEWVG